MNKRLTHYAISELAEEALVALIESSSQAKHDFGGEQRDWHCPRISKALTNLMAIFPQQAIDALDKAKTPYGDLISN